MDVRLVRQRPNVVEGEGRGRENKESPTIAPLHYFEFISHGTVGQGEETQRDPVDSLG